MKGHEAPTTAANKGVTAAATEAGQKSNRSADSTEPLPTATPDRSKARPLPKVAPTCAGRFARPTTTSLTRPTRFPEEGLRAATAAS